jgi:two-component system chemotaxis response regulator CheB
MTETSQAAPKPGPVVAIGLSADGLGAIRTILSGLPAGLDAPVLIVMHRGPQQVSRLPQVIGRHCALPVKEGAPTDTLTPGHVYLAPPDAHLVVDDGQLGLDRSEKVNVARPSLDVLFESVARAYGPRAIGVILSGAGLDGAQGLQAIRAAGGITIVQDPDEARFPRLPEAALAADGIDFTVPLAEIAPTLLAVLARRPGSAAAAPLTTEAGSDPGRHENAGADG